MAMRVELLVIDPQKDFCDPSGALYVDGADQDMNRLSDMVNRIQGKINDIHATLDSHHFIDCAHPVFWKGTNGKHPDPFTIISATDVRDGVWTTTQPGLHTRMLQYVEALEAGKRYPLFVWPPHCLIGTPGHAVWPRLFEAFRSWEEERFAFVDYVTKGSNILTEHYSAVKAEVPDPQDPKTQINSSLVNVLKEADIIPVAGEAGSHCLANTLRDIADAFGDDSHIKKITLLTDATSPVAHPDGLFAQMQEDFIKDMTARGMQLSTTEKFLAA